MKGMSFSAMGDLYFYVGYGAGVGGGFGAD